MNIEEYASKTGMTKMQVEEVMDFIINQVDEAKSSNANPYSYMQACLGSLILTAVNCQMTEGDAHDFINEHAPDMSRLLRDVLQSPILSDDGANMMRH